MYKKIIFIFFFILEIVNSFNNNFILNYKNKKNNIISKKLNNIDEYNRFLSYNKTNFYNIKSINDFNNVKKIINNNSDIIILNIENNKIIKNLKDILS